MFDAIRAQVLRFMRVPHDPAPPLGAPGSIRIFRAGNSYYKLRLFRWGAGQVGATVGLVFSIGFFWWFKGEVESARLAAQATPAQTITPAPAVVPAEPGKKPPTAEMKRRAVRIHFFREVAKRTPGWGIVLLEIFEVGGIIIFVAQVPITYAVVRLEFEQHWYIVTDRSLRIRTGLLRLQESTMSFANLQQVEVKQGPLQRLLGLADVHVQSAGGGSGRPEQERGDSLHTGIFHSVENATEIRDLILARLRQFRQAGLGDPDDHHEPAAGTEPPPLSAPAAAPHTDALAAAHELLTEARALRAALQ